MTTEEAAELARLHALSVARQRQGPGAALQVLREAVEAGVVPSRHSSAWWGPAAAEVAALTLHSRCWAWGKLRAPTSYWSSTERCWLRQQLARAARPPPPPPALRALRTAGRRPR